MKLVSWNVNGLRAAMTKGFMDYFCEIDADIFALQEIKLSNGQIEMDIPGYYEYWNYADKKGYSGTAIFTKIKPLNVSYGLGIDEHDTEGRVITLEFEDFYLVNVYTPNAQDGLKRIDYRMSWEDAFREHVSGLKEKKGVVICGDLNVAHEEMDLKNDKANRGKAGFSDEERSKMTELLNAGFTDVFRTLYPDRVAYTWWSYRFNARANDAGWRIDYFIVSDEFMEKVEDQIIHKDVMGSDHCPVELILK